MAAWNFTTWGNIAQKEITLHLHHTPHYTLPPLLHTSSMLPNPTPQAARIEHEQLSSLGQLRQQGQIRNQLSQQLLASGVSSPRVSGGGAGGAAAGRLGWNGHQGQEGQLLQKEEQPSLREEHQSSPFLHHSSQQPPPPRALSSAQPPRGRCWPPRLRSPCRRPAEPTLGRSEGRAR